MRESESSILCCPICSNPLALNTDNLCCQNDHKIPIKNNIISLIPENYIPNLTLAQKSGSWKLTSFLYERIWRLQSLALMTAGNFTVQKELTFLQEFISTLPDNSNICDLTCSTGVYGRFIQSKFPDSNMYFLDYSKPMLMESQKRNQDSSRSFYIQNFAENKSFIENSTDAFVCGGSWNEITKSEETLSQVYSALKPGGKTFWMGILKTNSVLGNLAQKVASISGGLHFDSSEFIIDSFAKQKFRNIKLINFKIIFILTAEK